MAKASDTAAIVSLGYEVVNAKLGHSRMSAVELQARAAVKAMNAVDLSSRDIGALFTGRPPVENAELQWNMVMVDALKLAPRATTSVTNHGAGHLSSLRYAMWAVCSGTVEFALCLSGSNAPLWLDSIRSTSSFESDPQFEACYQPITPTIYGQIANRYVHEYGITERQAARVAVEHRKWGRLHPLATMYGKPEITVEDVLSSRMVSTPFHLLDCATWYPGGTGVAVVVARAERARELSRRPVYIKGIGECVTGESVTEKMSLGHLAGRPIGNPLTTTGIEVAAADAYTMAGSAPSDVDLVQTQSPFTYMILMALEGLGLCEKGAGGSFVEGGGIDFETGLPVNTSGGMLSFGQPLNTNSLLIEAYEQLTGAALGRQVPDARTALVHFHGGPFSCHSVALLSTEA